MHRYFSLHEVFSSRLALLATVLLGMVKADDIFYGLNYGINQVLLCRWMTLLRDFSAIKLYTNRVRTFSMSIRNQGTLIMS